MNNPFAMDQAEKVGLGAALGGHALLLALLLVGLFQAVRGPMGSDGGGSGDGIEVEIVSEGMAAPDPAPAVVEEMVEPVPEPEVLPETVVDPLPAPKPLAKSMPKPQQKPVPVKKTVVKQPVKQTKTGTGRGGNSDFLRDMDKKLAGAGGGTGTQTKKGPGEGTGEGASTKTTGEIRKAADVAIASEVRPLIPGCAPSTSDNSSLFVFVQLNIGQNANLISANVYDVRGITAGNQAQVEQMKRCVLDSLRKASPYNLDPEQYETWRNHKVQLKVNFK